MLKIFYKNIFYKHKITKQRHKKMGNQCSQCQPVITCGRQALRQGLSNNTRDTLNKSQIDKDKNIHNVSSNSINSKSKQNAKTMPTERDQKLKTQDELDRGERSVEIIQLSYGIFLKGQFKGNLRDGKSEIKWPDGSKLLVNYSKNKPIGKVKFQCQNQGVYQGHTDGYIATGKGKMVLTDGSTYQGDWKDDKPHGKGIHKLSDGSTYEGQFTHGSKSGKGKYEFSNGSTYQGDFLNGYFHGRGKMIYNDGRQYVGEWKNGACHGKGIMNYNQFTKYEGQFVDGLRQGKGIYHFGDGRTWEGTWIANFQNGEGTYKTADGAIEKGIWKKGQRVQNQEQTRKKKISNILIQE